MTRQLRPKLLKEDLKSCKNCNKDVKVAGDKSAKTSGIYEKDTDYPKMPEI